MANHGLVPHKTWGIQDSSKIQTFMDCPRKYFYQYVLSWDSMEPKPYLVFGEGIHAAIEVLMNNGYSVDAAEAGFEAFMAVYNEAYHGDPPPEAQGVYSPAHALATIGEYAGKYERDEDLEVLHTEVAGTVPIDIGPTGLRLIHFRMDSIVRAKDGIWSHEHKTTKQAGRTWIDKWDLSFQVGVYTHVLHMLFPPSEVQGVKINAIVLALPTRADEAEGRLTSNKYFRVPQRRSLDMMNVWLWNANHWFDWIEHEFGRLEKCSPDDSLMGAFPQNTESCTKYWGCPFRAFCGAWPNPLRHAHQPPIGFSVRRWDPAERVEKAKKIIHLEEGKKDAD